MRKVLRNHQEVTHVWASQSQSEGSASRMFFNGPSIYSYGRHFEIARHVEGVVLFTTKDYSVSTSKHKSYVRRAVSHLDVFTVPSFEDHAQNVEYYLAEFSKAQAKVVKARSHRDFLFNELRANITKAARYCDKFKSHIPAHLRKAVTIWRKKEEKDTLLSPKELERIKASAKAELLERQEAEAKLREKNQKHMDEWRNGSNTIANLSMFPIALRIKDGRIETSHGAQITVRAALELWAKIKAGVDVKGLRVDHYTVTSYNDSVLTVGCHKIARSEIERMAAIVEKLKED